MMTRLTAERIKMIRGLMHIGVYTLDIETSIRFYVDKLGFELTWRGVVNHQTGQLPVATVRAGSCVIELVCPADLSRVVAVDGAVQHIALLTDDLVKTAAALRQRQVPIEEDISEIDYEGGVRHLFIRGPSRERIEIGEYLPRAAE